jgi:TIR domain
MVGLLGRTIPAGKTWWEVIGGEIQSCRSVVVIWTENSIKSNWVYEEADTGKRKRILIPVLFDKVEPPFGFGGIQAANLTAWDGDNSSPTFSHLIADIAAIPRTSVQTGERLSQK